MRVCFDRFVATIRPDEHLVMVRDQTGWRGAYDLKVPDCVALVPLPPRSPELNLPERVWLTACSQTTTPSLARRAAPGAASRPTPAA